MPTDNLRIEAAVTIEAAAGEKKLPTFSMVAYSGGELMQPWSMHPIVIDLKGLGVPSQRIPVRLDHDRRRGVGHTEKIEKAGGRLTARGVISRDTSWARDVANSGKHGFPWQASVGASVRRREFIPEKQMVTVNGRSFTGPLVIVHESRLDEVSFVDLGADNETEATIAAKHAAENGGSDMTGNGTNPQAADTQPDPAAERERVTKIADLTANHADIRARAMDEEWTAERTELEVYRAREKAGELERVRASRPETPAMNSGQGQANRRVDVLAAAWLLHGGQHAVAEKSFGEQVCAHAEDLRIHSLFDLARESLIAEHREVPRGNQEMVKASFSTISMPQALETGAEKMMLNAYTATPATWRSFCARKPVTNFREVTDIRPYQSKGRFEEVAADGELQHGMLTEETYTRQAKTYGKMFGVTRKDIINDDLGVLMEIPAEIGRNAVRSISDAVYTLILNNTNDFFHSDNGNLITGADSALSYSGLEDAVKAFREIVDADGKPVDISPAIVSVPPALEMVARALLKSAELERSQATGDREPIGNPLEDIVKLEVEPRLGNTAFHASASDAAWYLWSDPANVAAIVVSFLNGREAPTIEQVDPPSNVLGIQFRGFLDYGVDFQDTRAGQKSAGS